MSINKETASQLRKRGQHYTTFNPQVFDLIKNVDAAAIWVYLMTKSEGWTVRKSDIQKRFNIGRDKVTKAFGVLKELRLLEDVIVRDETKIIGRQLVIWSEQYDEKPVELKTSRTENQSDGKSGYILKDQSLFNHQDIPNNQDTPPQATEDKFSEADLQMAVEMIHSAKEQFPSLKADQSKWADDIRKLRELDGYSAEQIIDIWEFVRNDGFWSKNCQSVAKFRQRNKDGVKYIDLFSQQLSSKPKSYEAPVDEIVQRYRNHLSRITNSYPGILSDRVRDGIEKRWQDNPNLDNWNRLFVAMRQKLQDKDPNFIGKHFKFDNMMTWGFEQAYNETVAA